MAGLFPAAARSDNIGVDRHEFSPAANAAAAADRPRPAAGTNFDAEYSLEHPVRCQACGEMVATLKAIRLLRTEVNFTSTLPRRGRVLVCPLCQTLVTAELSNL